MKRKIFSLFSDKNSNSGFSLVEILVAVAILGFVAGPLLYSFAVSQRISSNSHYLGDATITSRNIVETIRKDNVAGVLAGAYSGTSPFGGVLNNPDAFDADAANGRYVLNLSNIPAGMLSNTSTGTSSTTFFDAEVIIDAGVYRDRVCGGSGIAHDPSDPSNLCSPGCTEIIPGINDFQVADYDPIDASYSQPRAPLHDPDRRAQDEFTLMYPTINFSGELKPYRRIITIDINREVISAAEETITITAKYEYDNIQGPPGSPPMPPEPYIAATETILGRTYVSDALHTLTVYFFYRPHYGTPGAGGSYIANDIFIINNLDMVDINLFLIKQRPIDASGNPIADPLALTIPEANYSTGVFQREYKDVPVTEARTSIRSNYMEDFSCTHSSPCDVCEVTHMHTLLRGELSGSNFIGSSSAITPQLSIQRLFLDKIPQDRMYNIEITIYRAGSSTPLLTFDATHLE